MYSIIIMQSLKYDCIIAFVLVSTPVKAYIKFSDALKCNILAFHSYNPENTCFQQNNKQIVVISKQY